MRNENALRTFPLFPQLIRSSWSVVLPISSSSETLLWTFSIMRFLAVLTSLSAVILLMAGKASAVANSALNACNCPNNCGYKVDYSCKYHDSIGIEDVTISGTC
ncbi:hypothetical protein C8J55DRAFT_293113 [Lentinula edodes]|uniref:Uncharacterized protein n=1 Tax=Lentinula lateritia TaxID=40482 RepID=A0A9W8ZRF8_9AGAR|nr:hypothetical protein C8J55DRAFT_293113 [Lentinula edodes]